MKIRLVLLIFVTILLLSGCGTENKNSGQSKDIEEKDVEENVEQVSDVEDVNVQTAAWQDEFTRDFLVSSEETEEGYYTFKSGVGGYKMLYPINAVMDQTYYQFKDQDYEVISFWEDREGENLGYSVVGRFYDREATDWIEGNLELMIGSEKLVTPKDFEKYTVENNDIYFTEYKHNINDNKENGFSWVFLSYINSRSSDKAIALDYRSKCLSETEECKLDVNQERERAKKIFHSVNFSPS